jgi:hypothetical protein
MCWRPRLLDNRSSSGQVLAWAEELPAHAVGSEHGFFSACRSLFCVKAALLAVAGGGHDLLVSRDAHRSVVAAVDPAPLGSGTASGSSLLRVNSSPEFGASIPSRRAAIVSPTLVWDLRRSVDDHQSERHGALTHGRLASPDGPALK